MPAVHSEGSAASARALVPRLRLRLIDAIKHCRELPIRPRSLGSRTLCRGTCCVSGRRSNDRHRKLRRGACCGSWQWAHARHRRLRHGLCCQCLRHERGVSSPRMRWVARRRLSRSGGGLCCPSLLQAIWHRPARSGQLSRQLRHGGVRCPSLHRVVRQRSDDRRFAVRLYAVVGCVRVVRHGAAAIGRPGARGGPHGRRVNIQT